MLVLVTFVTAKFESITFSKLELLINEISQKQNKGIQAEFSDNEEVASLLSSSPHEEIPDSSKESVETLNSRKRGKSVFQALSEIVSNQLVSILFV